MVIQYLNRSDAVWIADDKSKSIKGSTHLGDKQKFDVSNEGPNNNTIGYLTRNRVAIKVLKILNFCLFIHMILKWHFPYLTAEYFRQPV